MEKENIQKIPEKQSGFLASLTNKQLLRIEKTLFVIAVVVTEFYICIKFGGLKWVTDETILLYIVPPFAILGVWLRIYRKNKLKRLPENIVNKNSPII